LLNDFAVKANTTLLPVHPEPDLPGKKFDDDQELHVFFKEEFEIPAEIPAEM